MCHVDKDGICAQRGSRAGIKGNQGAGSTLQCIKANEKQENKQASKRKRQSQDTQICQPKATNAIKNDDTKLAKQKQKKCNNTTKRIVMFNLINTASPYRRKKQIAATNKRCKVTHVIDKILQKQNITS